MLQMT